MSEGPPSGRPLFLFVQCELPWILGPPSGRYLLRSAADGGAERVVVLGTLGAGVGGRPGGPDARVGRLRRRRAATRRRVLGAEPAPTPVTVTRATVVDPVPVSAERQARAWLADLEVEREVAGAFATLNRVLHAQRIAAADPYVREVSPAQAVTIRAGWGEGEQVADGRWLHAVELPSPGAGGRAGRRSAALRPDERLAGMLSAREAPLLCEELALRARLDFDQGRFAHAAVELDRALTAAATELGGEQRADLPVRVQELAALHGEVARNAEAALGAGAGGGGGADTGADGGWSAGAGADAPPGRPRAPAETEQEALGHALARLEAALRARSAAGSRES